VSGWLGLYAYRRGARAFNVDGDSSGHILVQMYSGRRTNIVWLL